MTGTRTTPTNADAAAPAPTATTTQSPSSGSRWSCRWRVGRKAGLALVGLALLAAVWSVLVASGQFPRQLLPSLLEIFEAGRQLATQGLLLQDVMASLIRAVTGFAIGAVVGMTTGVLTSTTQWGRLLLQPVLRVLSPIPTIGLVPLAILWFGIGENSKTLVIALGVFVPVWINSHAGMASTPHDYLKAARCLGSSRMHTLLRIVIPEAAPDIVAGLRVGVAMAFVLLVIAEMTGTTFGLGYRIYQAQLFSQADRLLFCLIVLGVLGALCDLVLARTARPLVRWAEEEH